MIVFCQNEMLRELQVSGLEMLVEIQPIFPADVLANSFPGSPFSYEPQILQRIFT